MGIVYIGSDRKRVGCERGGKKAKKGYETRAQRDMTAHGKDTDPGLQLPRVSLCWTLRSAEWGFTSQRDQIFQAYKATFVKHFISSARSIVFKEKNLKEAEQFLKRESS